MLTRSHSRAHFFKFGDGWCLWVIFQSRACPRMMAAVSLGKESDRVIPIRILKPALANLVDHRIYYYGFQSYRNFAHYSSACSETAASSPDWLQKSTSRGNPRSAVACNTASNGTSACNNLLRRRRKLRKQPPKAAQTGPGMSSIISRRARVSDYSC
ncbi:hypothetical protein FRC02_001029 [Tulasnella sp. 418]|nr:hypothetical protein FRC02_001029 [Tulasnella sp. 418]